MSGSRDPGLWILAVLGFLALLALFLSGCVSYGLSEDGGSLTGPIDRIRSFSGTVRPTHSPGALAACAHHGFLDYYGCLENHDG